LPPNFPQGKLKKKGRHAFHSHRFKAAGGGKRRRVCWRSSVLERRRRKKKGGTVSSQGKVEGVFSGGITEFKHQKGGKKEKRERAFSKGYFGPEMAIQAVMPSKYWPSTGRGEKRKKSFLGGGKTQRKRKSDFQAPQVGDLFYRLNGEREGRRDRKVLHPAR